MQTHTRTHAHPHTSTHISDVSAVWLIGRRGVQWERQGWEEQRGCGDRGEFSGSSDVRLLNRGTGFSPHVRADLTCRPP